MASAFPSQCPKLRGWAGWLPSHLSSSDIGLTDKVAAKSISLTLLTLFRVLIAATDFQPGDFIFREKELVVGANNQWKVRKEQIQE